MNWTPSMIQQAATAINTLPEYALMPIEAQIALLEAMKHHLIAQLRISDEE